MSELKEYTYLIGWVSTSNASQCGDAEMPSCAAEIIQGAATCQILSIRDMKKAVWPLLSLNVLDLRVLSTSQLPQSLHSMIHIRHVVNFPGRVPGHGSLANSHSRDQIF